MMLLRLAINWALTFFEYLFLARIITSFVIMFTGKTNAIFELLNTVTEPILAPIRNILNRSEALRSMPIDFSVLVVFLAISILRILF